MEPPAPVMNATLGRESVGSLHRRIGAISRNWRQRTLVDPVPYWLARVDVAIAEVLDRVYLTSRLCCVAVLL